MQGVCAATASAAQMQGRFGMGPWARGWVAGTGRGAFLWLGLSIILSLVLLGLGSIFSKCSCFPAPRSEAGAVERGRRRGGCSWRGFQAA